MILNLITGEKNNKRLKKLNKKLNKMSVTVRTKKLKNNKLSIFLDYYPPIKRADGKWTRREFLSLYLYLDPKSEREKTINDENQRFAKALREKRELEITFKQNGRFNVGSEKINFLDFFQKICENRKQNDGNFGNWKSAFKHLKSFTRGECRMGNLTSDFCLRFRTYLLEAEKFNTKKGTKISQNTASSYFDKFRCAVTEAYNSRFLIENPLSNIKGIPQIKSKREFLTQEELQHLANTNCELAAIKKAALYSALTGLRWSDIKSLTWGDIQKTEDTNFLHITQKKTKEVIVHPINNTALKLLGERGQPQERVFEGLKYSASNNDKLKRWVLRAGINKKITLHNFRHTYATLLLNKGADIFTVSKMLGHNSIKTTMIYAKVLSETKVSAANLIRISL